MKYTTEIIVEVPIETFIKKFDSAENMKHWQRGLVSVEHVSGDPGQLGAKMKLHFKIDKREFELLETITHRNLPHEFHGTYTMKGIHNTQENYFKSTEEEVEFFKNLNVSFTTPFIMTSIFIPSMIINILPFVIFISIFLFQ